MTLRAVPASAVLLFLTCQSGVSLDLDGGLRFPCTATSTTERSSGNCPGNLFCGADSACHAPDEQGTYACRGDFDCGGGFRCGPKGACVDPSRDALRAGAPEVTLDAGRVVASSPPWGAITALGVGRTFYEAIGPGALTDLSPVALSDGTAVYTVALSQQGLDGTHPPKRFFVGRAPLPNVTELAVARDQIYALSGGQLFRYTWRPSFDVPVAPLDAGAPFLPAVGTRLRVGNSAAPFVLEFSPDGGAWRALDVSGQFPPSSAHNLFGFISDMADTDGLYVYAIVDGKLMATLRSGGITAGTGPDAWFFQTFGLNSPGRDQLLQCGGTATGSNPFVFRSLHIGDNPDLNQIEHPLVAVQVDVVSDAGVSQHWMRLDPDATLPTCGEIQRHVARGNCPVCGPGEELVDLQWGIDPVTHTAALRSECRAQGSSFFYDLETDSGGFACTRTRRPGGGYRGLGEPVRARSHVSVAGVALGKNVLVRRDGLDDWVPLTLDVVPAVAQSYGPAGLVALGERTLFRETPAIGLALHQQVDRESSYPTWISGSWLFYDDGRVGPLSNLELPPADARFFAVPSRDDLQPPVRGTRATGSDGRAYLVMSANDTLLGAAVTDETALGPPREVDVKAVPEAQVEILSLAVLDPPAADAGVLFQGYVLTENRVFALDAVTEQRWTLSAIDVVDGEWRKVWADHDRGRLGYADGRVYALPSGVQLAGALPLGATDYEQHCGRTWALSPKGLYRLDASLSSGIGEWVEQAGVLPLGPSWQKMYGAANGELWVLAQDGTAALVRGSPCTQ